MSVRPIVFALAFAGLLASPSLAGTFIAGPCPVDLVGVSAELDCGVLQVPETRGTVGESTFYYHRSNNHEREHTPWLESSVFPPGDSSIRPQRP